MAPWSAVAKVFGRVDRLARPNVSLKYVKRGGMSLLSHVPYIQYIMSTQCHVLHRRSYTDTTHALHTQTKQNKSKHAACGLHCVPPAHPFARLRRITPSAPAPAPSHPPIPPAPSSRARHTATRLRQPLPSRWQPADCRRRLPPVRPAARRGGGGGGGVGGEGPVPAVAVAREGGREDRRCRRRRRGWDGWRRRGRRGSGRRRGRWRWRRR